MASLSIHCQKANESKVQAEFEQLLKKTKENIAN